MLLATSLTGLNVPASTLIAPIAQNVLTKKVSDSSACLTSSTEDSDCQKEDKEEIEEKAEANPVRSSRGVLNPVFAKTRLHSYPWQDTGRSASNGVKTEKEILESYFADVPVMVEIARCESNFRHTNKLGGVLRGLSNNQDVGVMQINERFHLEKAQKMEIDIYSIEGNLEFARYLYEKEGTKPWKASQKCWKGFS